MPGLPPAFQGYIRHLLKAKEMLGLRLCVLHNLYFYNKMIADARNAILADQFTEFKRSKLEGFMADVSVRDKDHI